MVKKTWWETSHWWTAVSQQYCHCVSISDVRTLKQGCLHKVSSSWLLHGKDRTAMLGRKPTLRDVQKMELLFLRLEKLKGLAGLELYLGVEGGRCTVQQGLPVTELHGLGHVGQHLDAFIQSLLEWLRNDGGVNSCAEHEKCLLDTSHFQAYFFWFFFTISFSFKTQDTQVRINWRHFSTMFFTSVWPPLLFSAVKTERKPVTAQVICPIRQVLHISLWSLTSQKYFLWVLCAFLKLLLFSWCLWGGWHWLNFRLSKTVFPQSCMKLPNFPGVWDTPFILLTDYSYFKLHPTHAGEDKKTSVLTVSAC